MPELALTPLDDLAVLDARGPDLVKFLQGQVSHDITLLAGRGSLLAALHNPQGRVVALLRLLHVAEDHALIVLPAELAQLVAQLLARFVLRAKLKITDAGSTWRVYGLTGPDAEAAARTRLHMPMDASNWRQLIIAPRVEPLPEADRDTRDSWRLGDIEAGLPEVLTATSGSFVAQMLNLDLVDAISLTKGCYTGQEVVARAHYRGQVKRRMQRFGTLATNELAAGQRVQLVDGRSAQIVMAAPAEGGGQQFLAVTTFSTGNPEQETSASGSSAQPPRLAAIPLPLPYALPGAG